MDLQELRAIVAKLRAAQRRRKYAPAYRSPTDAAVAAEYERRCDEALEDLDRQDAEEEGPGDAVRD